MPDMKTAALWVLGVVVIWGVYINSPIVFDFSIYWRVIESLRAGAPLYSGQEFYYAPWSLALLVPLTWLGLHAGAATLNTMTTLALLGACRASVGAVEGESAERAAILTGVLNPLSLVVLYMGQWDPLVLAGVLLGAFGGHRKNPWSWGVGVLLVSTKPTYALFVLALFAIAWLRFDARAKLIAAMFPLLALVGAGAVFGIDWPLRYIEHVRATPPTATNVSLAEHIPAFAAVFAVAGVGFVLSRTRAAEISLADVMLALALGFVCAPFIAGYHFVVASVPMAWIAARDRRLGAGLWVASWVASGVYFGAWSGALTLFGIVVCGCVAWMWWRERAAASTEVAAGEQRQA